MMIIPCIQYRIIGLHFDIFFKPLLIDYESVLSDDDTYAVTNFNNVQRESLVSRFRDQNLQKVRTIRSAEI